MHCSREMNSGGRQLSFAMVLIILSSNPSFLAT
jgi:hypothetical protein